MSKFEKLHETYLLYKDLYSYDEDTLPVVMQQRIHDDQGENVNITDCREWIAYEREQAGQDDKAKEPLALSDHDIQTINNLLNEEPYGCEVSVTSSDRLYIEPYVHDKSRYHVVTFDYDSTLVIEQNDLHEKYQQRITLENGESDVLLKALLARKLDKNPAEAPTPFDDMSDLDSAPF